MNGSAATHHKSRQNLRKKLRREGVPEAEIEERVSALAERQRQWRQQAIARGDHNGSPDPGPESPRLTRRRRQPQARASRANINPTKRDTVIALNGPLCAYCGKDMADRDTPPGFTIDHVVPLFRGGTSALTNLVACCSPCNFAKGHKTLAQLGWEVRAEIVERRRGTPYELAVTS